MDLKPVRMSSRATTIPNNSLAIFIASLGFFVSLEIPDGRRNWKRKTISVVRCSSLMVYDALVIIGEVRCLLL
jgi:hypothetical protein